MWTGQIIAKLWQWNDFWKIIKRQMQEQFLENNLLHIRSSFYTRLNNNSIDIFLVAIRKKIKFHLFCFFLKISTAY